ncbi:hypothetical protein [Streptomyces werraensis]|uniref:hypothetical protein n=1 Tax=Streptomyces werraensis TaxID=68284 RepID=UPI0034236EED
MTALEDDFDLYLLGEDVLAGDPYPDRPLQLDVLGLTDEGKVTPAVSIRTSPQAMEALFDQYRAVRLGLADRASKQARRDAERAERVHATEVALSRPALTADPQAHRLLLERLRDGLERVL